MAAIDFPPNAANPDQPQNGDTFSPPGLDTVYTYQNGVWTGGVAGSQQFMPLVGGNFTGDVTFNTDKIFLSTTGNANFQGDVDIDGNLALGSISDVEQAIIASSGGTPNAISNGSETLNFTGGGLLQSNTGYQPTLTNSFDLGAPTLTWKGIYSNAIVNTTTLDNTGDIRIGGTLPGSPNILLDASGSGNFADDIQIAGNPLDSSSVQTGILLRTQGRGVFAAPDGQACLQVKTTGVEGNQAVINADGSATFAGDITTTSLAGSGSVPVVVDADGKLVRGSATAGDIWTEINTQIYPTDASDSVLIGGTLPSAPAITLASDGSATFNGYVYTKNYLLVERLGASGNNTLAQFGTDTNTDQIVFGADGSAEFKNQVQSLNYRVNNEAGTQLGAYSSGEWFDKSSASDLDLVIGLSAAQSLYLFDAGGEQDNIILNKNGSADFAAGATTIAADGAVTVNKATYGTAFSIEGAGVTNAFIQSDGDSYFNQAVKVGNTYASPAVQILADGSADFAGDTVVGGDPSSGGNAGVKLWSVGQIDAARDTGSSSVFKGYTVGSSANTSRINADGSAIFAGAVTVASLGSGSNTYTMPSSSGTLALTSDIPAPVVPGDGQINVNVDANTGLSVSGDNATANQTGNTTRTISLSNSGVTAGSYTYASITVDAQGRLTSASSGAAPATPGNGALTIQSFGQAASATGTFTANQGSASTLTLPQIRYADLSGTPTIPTVGNGTITIVQPGTSNQTFTVNQSGNTTITLKNDNTQNTYVAGNGLSLSGFTFSVAPNGSTIAVSASGVSVNSAPQLTTARTLWGQSFNGTANVSGAISGATNITASGDLSDGTTAVPVSDIVNFIASAPSGASPASAWGSVTFNGILLSESFNVESTSTDSSSYGVFFETEFASTDYSIVVGMVNPSLNNSTFMTPVTYSVTKFTDRFNVAFKYLNISNNTLGVAQSGFSFVVYAN